MEPRKYGPFPFRPINRRPALHFPNGERIALWVIPNLEVFHLDTPMPGDTLQRPGTAGAQVPMVREWAQRDYGNRVGVYRMMEVMQRYEVRGTVALNSDLCDAHPQVIEDTRALGWEFMGHGKTNTHRQTEIPPQTERQHVMDIFERIERATGTRPKGWLGPGLQETWNTLDYLIEAGCEYVADWVNDDQPYWMEIGGKRLVSIPYSFEVNDSVSIVRNKNSPLEFERIIRDQFDVMYREGESSGRVFAISLHPYIIGQPHRIGALDRALDYICGHAGVWKATGSEIVRYCVETGQVLD
ncbi:MAG: polysaccharide deacetylase family protein [Gammaproteobacteria bacterium]|nr:polysaccharide deacetylase family protein [Gammaproteobacteria bacterium]